MADISEIDRKILRVLQRDNKITNAALAELVGLSPPACLKRVKRLQEEGVIEKNVAILNPKQAGIGITMIVEVEMESDRADMNDEFIRRVNTCPQVSQCYQVTGEVDFVLIVNVPDMEAFQTFTEQVLYSYSNMRKFRTLISMRRNKFSTEVPL
ncbi:Lrp/AsnC family transcriptional regulator [Litoribrevibacter albus]|uniref:ArsR family transcriptional regulator n=1 Tax=Litoribrevibacter albus TaxID=1473156 RepID=A0AA37SCV6_9GAMM|nr:Lrp/AsnC family transcriptional regulator [Litoribrevibacter albus]GLQ32133.1 ArsR family transcriptional regulator [Litoribrevibacter albus]